jgi:predicted ATPase
MISLIEALDFRCLKYISQPLDPFHVLVGPNASGKTTFLDVVSFLGQLVSGGLEVVLNERTQNFQDLVWGRSGDKFELALEARVPTEILSKLANKSYDRIRYEVSIGLETETGEPSILRERVLLKQESARLLSPQRDLFPLEINSPKSVLLGGKTETRTIVNKGEKGHVSFYSEVAEKSGKGWVNSFKLGPRKSALGNLPEDETKYPASTWLKGVLSEGVQPFILNSILIRKASPPKQGRGFRPDGSNLPWVIHDLRGKSPNKFDDWISHLRTALPDIVSVRTPERPDDRHRYLIIQYEGGLEIPSWMASDGTLRLMALTLPAYLDDFKGIYLIEEPENGIHPRAVESMFQSLSSVYGAQILMATHSPVVLSIATAKEVLCFAKTPTGSTDIVSGVDHPRLKEWKQETNLGELFAAGVLG